VLRRRSRSGECRGRNAGLPKAGATRPEPAAEIAAEAQGWCEDDDITVVKVAYAQPTAPRNRRAPA
jgi:hypothetical protein